MCISYCGLSRDRKLTKWLANNIGFLNNTCVCIYPIALRWITLPQSMENYWCCSGTSYDDNDRQKIKIIKSLFHNSNPHWTKNIQISVILIPFQPFNNPLDTIFTKIWTSSHHRWWILLVFLWFMNITEKCIEDWHEIPE